MAIDGKTLRGSGKKGSNELLNMVPAYAVQSGLNLAQAGTCGKGHERAEMKALLDVLILKGGIITMDALGCQTELAEKIVARGGDDVLQVEDNPKNLAEAMREFFDEGGMIESIRQIGDKVSVDQRYAIGSCGEQTVDMLAKASRSHWPGIENRLHWTLEVVFREDQCRARVGQHSARNLSVLHKFVLTSLRKEEGSDVLEPPPPSCRPKRELSRWLSPTGRKTVL